MRTISQMWAYKCSNASSHAYKVCHIKANNTKVGSSYCWKIFCQYTLCPISNIKYRNLDQSSRRSYLQSEFFHANILLMYSLSRLGGKIKLCSSPCCEWGEQIKDRGLKGVSLTMCTSMSISGFIKVTINLRDFNWRGPWVSIFRVGRPGNIK